MRWRLVWPTLTLSWVCGSAPLFRAPLLERLPALRCLITTGARNASFDTDAATDLGITVCGTPGEGEGPTELTWGLIIGLMRRIAEEDRATRDQGKWGIHVGHGLRGKTLALLGLGHIGSLVARVGNAFDMNVIAWSQNLTAERAAECNATLVDRDTLFAEGDVVSVHVRLSDRTRGLVGAHEIGLMKPSAILVNISRGPIVDEAALVDALERRAIGGAALDTFDVEPLPVGHPFLTLDNTLITPHVGYVTQEGYRAFYSWRGREHPRLRLRERRSGSSTLTCSSPPICAARPEAGCLSGESLNESPAHRGIRQRRSPGVEGYAGAHAQPAPGADQGGRGRRQLRRHHAPPGELPWSRICRPPWVWKPPEPLPCWVRT